MFWMYLYIKWLFGDKMIEWKFSNLPNIECFMFAFEANYRTDSNFTGEYHDFWEDI